MIQRDVSNKSEKNVKDLNKDISKLFKGFLPKGESQSAMAKAEEQ